MKATRYTLLTKKLRTSTFVLKTLSSLHGQTDGKSDRKSRKPPVNHLEEDSYFEETEDPSQHDNSEEESFPQGSSKKTQSKKLDDGPLPPKLKEESTVLKETEIQQIAEQLPPRVTGYMWNLAYSTTKHGMSLKTMYRTMAPLSAPVLLVIKDTDGQTFGSFSSSPFKVSESFYGTGETFLFTFQPKLKVFKWTGENYYFVKANADSLIIGGGRGHFGLWLDSDLYHGQSYNCETFNNDILSKREDFFIKDLEVWTFK
ncbi:TLD domain-containing protein 2 isoform X2 [Protopterus annectens]|uniref:TLD domain-containing protein 2 isoform X2 n=1 Tax=Protopterus annectens TaxID=7888 RepID=UPI001CF9DA5E|nr:TLD domain-containing protein 2 isoform X2 [Protopterus annectens]